MNLDQLIYFKRNEILQIAARNGAYDVRVFGSVARGEAQPGSNVDFLVNLEQGHSLLDLAHILCELQALLGCQVDVITEAGLRPRISPQVLEEAVHL